MRNAQSSGSACSSLPQEFLNHQFSEKWNQVRKHLLVPGNAVKHLRVAVGQGRLTLVTISISTNGENLSRQPAPMLNYPYKNQRGFFCLKRIPCSSSCTLSPVLSLNTTGKKMSPTYFLSPSGICTHRQDVPELSLLQEEQSQLSHSPCSTDAPNPFIICTALHCTHSNASMTFLDRGAKCWTQQPRCGLGSAEQSRIIAP